MAKEQQSLTQRLGGNRTVVLVVVVILLLCFTVASEVIPALGLTGDREFIRFTVGGRTVRLTQSEYAARLNDWQRFRARLQRVGPEDFMHDLMIEALADEAGVTIPDGTLRSWIENLQPFRDVDGTFDRELFDTGLKEHFGSISPRRFEAEARRFLKVNQYREMLLQASLPVSDAEAYARWKGEHPKVRVRYTWLPVETVRAGLDASAVTQEALDLHWANPKVQKRFEAPPRRTFEALWIVCDEFPDDAFRAVREKFKDDAALVPTAAELSEYWNQRRGYDFDIQRQSAESRAALFARNPPPPPPPTPEGQDPPPPPPATPDAVDLDNSDQVFERFFRATIEKEVWLRKYMARLLREAKDGGVPLADVLARHSDDGVPVRLHVQEEPVDQYQVEKLPGVGIENCSLRWVLNDYGPDREGTVHPDVLERSPLSERLETRGWVVARVLKVHPAHIPPLADVREKVVEDLLAERAKDEARARLEALAAAASEKGEGGFEAVAKERGHELAEAGPFNEYSWRPPLPKHAPGVTPPPASEQWKDPNRRLSSVMSRYFAYRAVPPGTFAPVIEDTFGTGAFYLVQILDRQDPPFEEMTLAQKKEAMRQVQSDRMRRVAREVSYDSLRDRLGLLVDGKPAPSSRADEPAAGPGDPAR